MADETLDISNNALYDEVQRLRSEVMSLRNLVANHSHKYAAATTPGGGATALDLEDEEEEELAIVGLSTDGARRAASNPNVVVDGDQVRAGVFVGDLQGTAEKAERFDQAFTLKFAGALDGEVSFDGGSQATADLELAASGVIKGEYGPIGNMNLSIGETFTVPQLSIDNDGRVTWAENKLVTVPANTGLAGTTDATQFDDNDDERRLLYLIGAASQSKSVRTFSDVGVYVKLGKLYAGDVRVVDESTPQPLSNKTYEGFTLGAACERDVDDAVQGTLGSSALATSNALAAHTHMYAAGTKPGGPAAAVATQMVMGVTGNPVVDVGGGALAVDPGVRLESGTFVANDLAVKRSLEIPGGQLWIDENADVVDVAEYNSGDGRMAADQVYTLLVDDNGFAYTVQECIENINTTLTLLQQSITALDGACSSLQTSANAHVSEFNGVKSQVTGLVADGLQLRTEISNTNLRIDTLKARVEALEAIVQPMTPVQFTLPAHSMHAYDLATVYGANASAVTRFVAVMRKDEDTASDTYGMYVDNDEVIIGRSGSMLTMYSTSAKTYQCMLIVR